MKLSSASMVSSKRRILITTGDSDGIGWEVTSKALRSIGPRTGFQFLCYRNSALQKTSRTNASRLGLFKVTRVASLDQALALPFDAKTLVEIQSSAAAGRWVEEAAIACLKKDAAAMVTAPLSKTSIVAAGMKDLGHTEILARVSGCPDLFMGFIGTKFSVLLATGHIPLSQVPNALTQDLLQKAVDAAIRLKSLLPTAKQKLPIGLLGINPHSGEEGLIGDDERRLEGVFRNLKTGRVKVEGPLVPDAAFLPQNWKRYSVYLCPYHDQGLIPFKMVHGFDHGVHLTLGLPFVRTSVDHGTAKDIFGKNRADSGSMKDAIITALRLSKEQNK